MFATLIVFVAQAESGPFEALGRYLHDNRDYILDNLTSVVLYGLGALIGVILLVLLILVLAIQGLYGLGGLATSKSTMTFGRRRDQWYDFAIGPPIRQAQKDTVLHNELVGPSGQGKTTLMEIKVDTFLKLGITTFIFETSGDLSRRCAARARAYGRPVYAFDPPHLGKPNVYRWNPVAGDPEIAAEQAMAAMNSASASRDPYWKSVSQDALRTMVHTASAYARDQLGTEPTLTMIEDLLTDATTRDRILGVKPREASGALTMDAPWISRRDMNWWTNTYFTFDPKERLRQFNNVQTALSDVLHRGMVRDSLSPAPDEAALEMLPAMNSGGLVIFRADPASCGEITYQYLILWMIGMFWQAADRRHYLSQVTGEQLPHVAAFFDEIHNSFPGMNTQAAENFAKYYTYARHLHIYVTTAFQAYGLLPPIIKDTTAANAANRFLSGRLSVPDAMEGQAIAGRAERQVTDTRSVSDSMMPGSGRTTTAKVWRDEHRMTADKIRRIPMRNWLYIGTSDSSLREPTIFRARKPPQLPEPVAKKTKHPPKDGGGGNPGGRSQANNETTAKAKGNQGAKEKGQVV